MSTNSRVPLLAVLAIIVLGGGYFAYRHLQRERRAAYYDAGVTRALASSTSTVEASTSTASVDGSKSAPTKLTIGASAGLDPKSSNRFVDQLYADGAMNVQLLDVAKKAGSENSNTVVVTLPTEAAKRKSFFRIAAHMAIAEQETVPQDNGQKYLMLKWQ